MPRNVPGALSGLVAAAAIVFRLSATVPQHAEIGSGVGHTQAQPPGTGSIHVELPVEGDDGCVLCHEDTSRGAVAHEPVAAGLCTTCHVFTGSGDQTRVSLAAGTPDDTAALCTSCHVDIAEQLTRATVHAPAVGACVLCHAPHGGPNAALLLEPVNTLCVECHRTRTSATATAATLTLFGRDVPAADQAVLSGPVVDVDPIKGVGHPVAGHPVSGPEDPAAPGRPFTCVSCHAAHGADAAHLKRFGGENPTDFCVKCH